MYARLAPLLLTVARSILRDHTASEDAVQSAFCKIMTLKRAEIRAVDNPRAWLIAVVRNECLMKLRSDKRALDRAQRRAETDPNRTDAPENDPLDFEAVQAAVHDLPDHLREIIVLKHAASLTFDQIAEVTQQNRNTAASRYRDALAKLRSALRAARTDLPRFQSAAPPEGAHDD